MPPDTNLVAVGVGYTDASIQVVLASVPVYQIGACVNAVSPKL